MPEIRNTIEILGVEVSVVDVPIRTASESFAEYELEDGSQIKVKFVASSFLRVEGQYTPDGKPVYLVSSAPAVNVLSSPDALMRPPQAAGSN